MMNNQIVRVRVSSISKSQDSITTMSLQVVRSCIRCASMDMRLVISPTVLVCRSAAFNTRAFW